MVKNKNQQDILNRVQAYREKFKYAPLGRWISFVEFGPFPTDSWEFYADNTGKLYEYSGSGEHITFFEWQVATERTIKFRIVDQDVSEKGAAEASFDCKDSSDKNELMDWVTIAYDFKVIEHYVPIVVMFQVPEDDTFKFWMTTDYLQFEDNAKL